MKLNFRIIYQLANPRTPYIFFPLTVAIIDVLALHLFLRKKNHSRLDAAPANERIIVW